MHPRRVRGGIRLTTVEFSSTTGWAAQRWLRLIEDAAAGPRQAEGLNYAKLGQARSFLVDPGRVRAIIQGRADRAYSTELSLAQFNEQTWEAAVAAMSQGAVFGAKLLTGEVPAGIEDIFAPLGLNLCPAEPADVQTHCTCGHEEPWCKHACCAAYLLAERLAIDPSLMFTLRGQSRDDLLERLRQKRAMSGVADDGAAPVYSARVPGSADIPIEPLEQCLDRFWEQGPELLEVELPLEPPPVSHPLLRRLGPSPFQIDGGQAGIGKFPLVGLLATCYDVISQAALTGELPSRPPEPDPEPEEPQDTPIPAV